MHRWDQGRRRAACDRRLGAELLIRPFVHSSLCRVETITFTDEEQAHLQEGVFPGLEQFDDVGLLVDATGDLDVSWK